MEQHIRTSDDGRGRKNMKDMDNAQKEQKMLKSALLGHTSESS